jgi:hypothetical protein
LKNPFLSFWLSGANMWAGAVRSFWTAELQRQQTAMINDGFKHMTRLWTGAWMQDLKPVPAKRRRPGS